MGDLRIATAGRLTITRPSNTTAYAAGDLVANDTTAGNVTPFVFKFSSSPTPVFLRKVTLRKSKADVTSASFRLWVLNAAPTVVNGDNGAIEGTFLATALFEPIEIDTVALLTAGGAIGSSIFDMGLLRLTHETVYGLLEARAAYTPASGETFTLDIEGEAA